MATETLNRKVGVLDRRETMKAILDKRGDALVVTGLGSSCYDAGVHDHPNTFYGARGSVLIDIKVSNKRYPMSIRLRDGAHMNAAMVKVLSQPNVRTHLAEGDKEPVGSSPAEFKKFIATDAERLRAHRLRLPVLRPIEDYRHFDKRRCRHVMVDDVSRDTYIRFSVVGS